METLEELIPGVVIDEEDVLSIESTSVDVDAFLREQNYLREHVVGRSILSKMEAEMSLEWRQTGNIEVEHIIEYIKRSDAIMGYPIGSHLSMSDRIAHYRAVIVENSDAIHSQSERIQKAKLKERIGARLERMTHPAFFTQTFTDGKTPEKPSAYIHYWRQIFADLGIDNWCLVTDYGKKKGRLHFHGFLDLPPALYEETKEKRATTPFFRIDTITLKGKSFETLHFRPLEPYGFNLIKIINPESDDVNKSLNYCVKYLVKDLELLGVKHELFASRAKRKK